MKLIQQLFWILAFSLAGELLSLVIAPIITMPGSVIGMILLFIALHYRWLSMDKVREVGNWLTGNMAIFFVPAGVALMTHFDLLRSTWWQLILIILVSTVLMMVLVGKIVQAIKHRLQGPGLDLYDLESEEAHD